MILSQVGYGYNDLTIMPAVISEVRSRKDCNPFINGMLPIFTAPMDTVVNIKNKDIFKKNYINYILPRTANINDRINNAVNDWDNVSWSAFSLTEFEEYFCNPGKLKADAKYVNALIDIANGHMKIVYELAAKAKELAKKEGYFISIMVGNIANPKTYQYIAQNYNNIIEYVRVGIGSGAGCITSSNTAIHYPMASLIDECHKIKENNPHRNYPKIIADGGIRNYSDVIKALALGADYVMIGSLFAQCFESAAKMYTVRADRNRTYGTDNIMWTELKEDYYRYSPNLDEFIKRQFIKDYDLLVEFYGMSTKKAQRNIDPNAPVLRTSEGCTKELHVKFTLNQWAENMIDYLKSAMSYTGNYSLDTFIGNVNLVINSPAEILAVNK